MSKGWCWLLAGTSWSCSQKVTPGLCVVFPLPHGMVADFQNECPKRTRWNLYGLLCPSLGSSIASVLLPSEPCSDWRRGTKPPPLYKMSVSIVWEEEMWEGSAHGSHLGKDDLCSARSTLSLSRRHSFRELLTSLPTRCSPLEIFVVLLRVPAWAISGTFVCHLTS